MEVMVVAILLVLLFPPRELPKIARTVAQLYGQLRKTADDFRSAVLMDDELRAPIREIRSVYHDARYEIQKTRTRMQDEFHNATKDLEGEHPLPSDEERDDADEGSQDLGARDHLHEDDPNADVEIEAAPPTMTASGGVAAAPSTVEGDEVEPVEAVEDASRPPPRRVQITAAKRAPRLRPPSGRVAQGPESGQTAAETATAEEADAPRSERGDAHGVLPVTGAPPAPIRRAAADSGTEGE